MDCLYNSERATINTSIRFLKFVTHKCAETAIKGKQNILLFYNFKFTHASSTILDPHFLTVAHVTKSMLHFFNNKCESDDVITKNL